MSSTRYQYTDMRLDRHVYDRQEVAPTGDHLWVGWEAYLKGAQSGPWQRLVERYTPPCQLAILRGVTLFGLPCRDWNTVFTTLVEDRPPFQWVNESLAAGRPCNTRASSILITLVNYTQRPIHFPPLYPAWLAHLGWRQRDYIKDLWDTFGENFHNDYHHPWPDAKLGDEWPEIERIKQLGEVTRSEIDKVTRHSAQRHKH